VTTEPFDNVPTGTCISKHAPSCVQVTRQRYEHSLRDPRKRYYSLIDSINSCNNTFFQRMTLADLGRLDADLALGYFRKVRRA
jgi:hypothetical protein